MQPERRLSERASWRVRRWLPRYFLWSNGCLDGHSSPAPEPAAQAVDEGYRRYGTIGSTGNHLHLRRYPHERDRQGDPGVVAIDLEVLLCARRVSLLLPPYWLWACSG